MPDASKRLRSPQSRPQRPPQPSAAGFQLAKDDGVPRNLNFQLARFKPPHPIGPTMQLLHIHRQQSHGRALHVDRVSVTPQCLADGKCNHNSRTGDEGLGFKAQSLGKMRSREAET